MDSSRYDTDAKPNKRAIRKWVKALRSDEYRQGKGFLARKNKTNDNIRYCCLGVACDIAPKSLNLKRKISTAKGHTEGEGSVTVVQWNNFDTVLPPKVANWLGVRTSNPKVITEKDAPYHTSSALAFLNDEGHTFNQIADYLELTYLKD